MRINRHTCNLQGKLNPSFYINLENMRTKIEISTLNIPRIGIVAEFCKVAAVVMTFFQADMLTAACVQAPEFKIGAWHSIDSIFSYSPTSLRVNFSELLMIFLSKSNSARVMRNSVTLPGNSSSSHWHCESSASAVLHLLPCSNELEFPRTSLHVRTNGWARNRREPSQ